MAHVNVSTFIESIGDRAIVVKQRSSSDAEGKTEQEGRWLIAARHPGVVRLRRALPSEAALATDLDGIHNLATFCHPPPALAAVLAAVATTLADLHRRGMAHGNIIGPHVILRGGTLVDPVLCSPSSDGAGGLVSPVQDISALGKLARAQMTARPQLPATSRAWSGWAETIDQLVQPDTAASAFTASELFAALAGGGGRGRGRGRGGGRFRAWGERG